MSPAFNEKKSIKPFFQTPAFLFGIVTCVINFYVFLGPYQLVRIHDTYNSFMIKLKMAADQLLLHGLTSWDPWSLSGSSFLASILHHPFHPAIFMNMIFPLWFVNACWILIFHFFSGYGMYLYLNRILKLSSFAAFAGGLFYLSLVHKTPLDRTFVFLFPMFLFLFYQMKSISTKDNLKYLIFFVPCFLSASVQFTLPYFFIFHLLEFFFISRRPFSIRIFLYRFTFLWVIYGLIHLPTIYVFITEAGNSYRQLMPTVAHIDIATQEMLPFLYRFFSSLTERMDPYFRMTPFFHGLLPLCCFLITLFFLRSRQILFGWLFLLTIVMIMALSTTEIGMEVIEKFGAISEGIHFPRLFTLIYPMIYCIQISFGLFFLEKIFKKESVLEMTAPSFISPRITFSVIFPILIGGLLTSYFFYFAYFPHLLSVDFKRVPNVIIYFQFILLSLLLLTSFFLLHFKFNLIRMRTLSILFLLLFPLLSSKAGHMFYHIRVSFKYILNNEAFEAIRNEQKKDAAPFRAALIKSQHNFMHFPAYLNYQGIETMDGMHSLYSARYYRLFAKVIDPPDYLQKELWIAYFRRSGMKALLLSPLPAGSYQRCYSFTERSFYENLVAFMNVKYIVSTLPFENPSQHGLRLFYDPGITQRSELANCSNIYKKHLQDLKGNLKLNQVVHPLNRLKNAYLQCKASYWIYTFDHVAPRSFITSSWQTFDSFEQTLNEMTKRNVTELMSTVLLFNEDIENIILPVSQKRSQSFSKIVRYEPDYIKIRGFSKNKGILTLLNNYHPKWRAYINGKRTVVFPAYYSFQGIIVPEGKFTVEFKYEDPFLNALYVFMFIGIVSLILFILFQKRFRLPF